MNKGRDPFHHDQTRSLLALMIVALVAVLAIGVFLLIAFGSRLGLTADGIRQAITVFVIVCGLAGVALDWYFRRRK